MGIKAEGSGTKGIEEEEIARSATTVFPVCMKHKRGIQTTSAIQSSVL